MSINIKNGIGSGELGVNAEHEALVTLNQDASKAGHACLAAEVNSDGAGVGRIVRTADISSDYRLRVGLDSVLFADTFNHGQVNCSKYKVVNTTAVNALSGGRWVFNSGNSVTAGQGTQFSTWSYYKLALSGTLYIDFELMISAIPQLNNVVEFGWFLCSGVTAPTDGVLFRLNASGVLQGVNNNNGSETVVNLTDNGVAFVPSPNTMYHMLIVAHNDRTEFWIDDVCMGVIVTPLLLGSPCLSMSLPVSARIYNSNTVATAQRLEISNISVTIGDQNVSKLSPTVQAIQGLNGVCTPDGVASGQTGNFVNSTGPVSATLSNTAAGYATLGGQFQFAAVAGAETDYALFAYLNPAGTAAIPGKNLVITGVTIDVFNMGAVVATTPHVLQWSLGIGSSGVSLATADSATTGGCAPRRRGIGVQMLPVGAVIGQNATQVGAQMNTPDVVEPGTYCHIIVKIPVGTATASQIIRGMVSINSYFE